MASDILEDGVLGEENGPTLAVFGRIVTQADFHKGNGVGGLIGGEKALEHIARKALQGGAAVVGVDVGAAEGDVVADLDGRPSGFQFRGVGESHAKVRGGHQRRADAREEHGPGVAVGQIIELNAVEDGLVESHGREGGAHLVADG